MHPIQLFDDPGARTPPRVHAATLVVIACLVAAGGCARSGLDATAAAAEKLSPAATAYVAIPEDGRFGTKVYTGSGVEVATLVARALSPRLRLVEVAGTEQPVKSSLAEAKARGFTYLIRPSILRWENHDSDWSGGRDRAKILLEVFYAATGDAADVAVVEGRGGPDTALPPDAAETPAAVLEIALRPYAERLVPLQAAARRR